MMLSRQSPSPSRGAVLQQGQRLLVAALLVSLAAIGPTAAYAWGGEGHRIVARLAEERLAPAARAEIERLLTLEPGATLESISTWADEVRSPSTAAWHYVNFPRGATCDFDAAPLCIDGMCVVAAIERQAAVLASGVSDEVKLKALKYVVHFVADVHQPLHAGFADDRGGNSYQVQAFGRGSNLHAVWDSGMVANWPGGRDALLAGAVADADGSDAAHKAGSGDGRGAGTSVGAARWAEESCRIAGKEGFYPEGHKLEVSYMQTWAPALVHQLAVAGQRLAALLNSALAK